MRLQPLPLATLPDAARGILWSLLAMFIFTLSDAIAKYLVLSYPVIMVAWARFIFQMAFMVLYLGRRFHRVMVTRRAGLQLTRSGLMVIMTVFFFIGVQHLPLADANAVYFVSPILVTVFAIPVLGERVGLRRWIGVAVGFVGALLIFRPGTDAMRLALLFPLASATASAVYTIITRALSTTDGPMTMLFYTAYMGIVVTSAMVPFVWVTPDWVGWGMMVCLGFLSGLGHWALIRSLAAAPASTVSPYVYTMLLWSVPLGFVVFGDIPDGWTIGGATLIAVAGLYIFHRERARRGE